ncbi:MAG: tyrosine-type recombinase/integrase [bacterium]|nr:tyrosine-type recombinase/integrase [bacterium]
MTIRQIRTSAGMRYQLSTTDCGVRRRCNFDNLPDALRQQAACIEREGDSIARRENAAPAASQTHGLTIAELFATWLRHCDGTGKHSKSYKETRRYLIAPMLQFCTEHGVVLVDQISKSVFDQYVLWRKEQGVSVSTVHHDFVVLHAAIEHAVSRDLLDVNRLRGYWKGTRIVTKTIEAPSPAELKAVMEALGPDARKLFWFLCTTGCRVSEACELQAEDVGADCIRFWRGVKGGNERHAPRPAFPFDLPIAGHAFTLRGNPWKRENVLHTLWKACRLAGVKRFCVHALRHANATYSIANGEDVYSVMARCGWQSFSVMQRYVAVARRYQNCGEFVPRWIGGFFLFLALEMALKTPHQRSSIWFARRCACFGSKKSLVRIQSPRPRCKARHCYAGTWRVCCSQIPCRAVTKLRRALTKSKGVKEQRGRLSIDIFCRLWCRDCIVAARVAGGFFLPQSSAPLAGSPPLAGLSKPAPSRRPQLQGRGRKAGGKHLLTRSTRGKEQ